ncbi:hypothetical protein A3860_00600 [Niastella vici]|uniref:SGNH hydrolase-type esterase domain-containing protein n=1 Tax=Niastella vici TaxID=1703345 RepID=A0A1V9G8F5_9BACT|nr:SGNH/GDSL hydrolase family protein [Niastella vici]OQP66903.1 hypothetical protein A3860_00600 [Niastella vici]
MGEDSLKLKKLVCIGDSHASFFAGKDMIQKEYPDPSINAIPFLEGIRLGPVLAYSLHKENTTNCGREKLFEIVAKLDKEQASILFCFGEIDCRFHIIKQAERQGISLEEGVRNCVDSYFKVIKEVKDLGFDVFVWNAIPTSYLNQNPEYPHYGNHQQRNLCTRCFNDMLKSKCNNHGIVFVDVFDALVVKRLFTKEHYLFDGVHLGQIAMPLFLREIKQYFPQIKLPLRRRVFSYYELIKVYSLFKARKFRQLIVNKVRALQKDWYPSVK